MNAPLHVPPKVVEAAGCRFASPDLKGRYHTNGTLYHARGIFIYNIKEVLHRNNKWHAKRKKPVSESTRSHRFIECVSMGHDLHNLGYRIMLPTSMKAKHVVALCRYWEDSNLAPSTVVQKVSILRTFLGWVGKEGVMEFLTPEKMFKQPELIKRSLVAKEDKSWDKKTDILELIAQVERDDKHVGRQLRLSHFFGLRAKETMMFRPCVDYDAEASVLRVNRGSKGGRTRVVLVETQEQHDLLKELASYCYDNNESMMPRRASLGSWLKHFYRVCNKHGISRKNGMTPHGLRHGYAHRLYEEKTGHAAAAAGGETFDMDVIQERIARLLVAEDLGHSRVSISSAYLG